MAHFAFIAPPLRGHYKPLSHLAAELIARGHRATFVHQADAAPLVEAQGAQFAAIGSGAPPLPEWTVPMTRIRGVIGLRSMMKGMVRFIDMFCAEAPATLRRIAADAVIQDQMEAGGGLVAEHLGLPWASIADALPINREPGVPPPYVGWSFERSEGARRRNRGGWAVSDLLMRPVHRAVARNAAMLGLPPRRRLDDCLSPMLQIAQGVPGFDFPREELPPTFHYAGNFRTGRPEPFDLPPGDDRPLVFCTLGTLQGSRLGIFRKVAAACAALDLRLLVTQGGLGDLRRAERLPGDPLIYDWIPQEEVLAQADMVVSHAGLNTVIESLAAGLPMVLMPIAFEQPAIAARIARAGAGIGLSRNAPERSLRAAIAELRAVPIYRERAQALRREIAAAGGVRRAADLIEAKLL